MSLKDGYRSMPNQHKALKSAHSQLIDWDFNHCFDVARCEGLSNYRAKHIQRKTCSHQDDD